MGHNIRKKLDLITRFINDNNLEKGVVLINEKKNESYNLRQFKFTKEDYTFIKKVSNISEIQDYLFHSSNEMNINKTSLNVVDNDLIHVYFKKTIDVYNNTIDISFPIIIINFDIYNINCCDILNIKKSLSVYFTLENIINNNFTIKNIKRILDFILKYDELTDLIHISYDTFINKLENYHIKISCIKDTMVDNIST